MKLVIWLVIVALVVAWVVRSKKKPAQKEGSDELQGTKRRNQAEAMLQCARCGTYFPASEAVTPASGKVFCCEEHRRQVSPGD